MDWVQICTDYYKAGYYKADDLKIFVAKGKISTTDFKTITGQEYTA